MPYFNIYFYIFVSFIIFFFGLLGLLISKRNSFLILVSLEIIFMSIHLNFTLSSLFLDDIFGMLMVLYILAISGCEISLGLALFILLFRTKNVMLTDKINLIKG